MASTTFIDNQTIIYAEWLNQVNDAVFNGNFQSPSITATNMICTGTASGVGFVNLVNNTFSSPAPIGSTTPNTGAFTTLSASSLSVSGAISGNSASFSTALPIASGGTGLTSVGTTNYALTSNGSSLVYKKLGLGMTGETWYDVTGSRGFNVTYTNTYGYPIQVSMSVTLPAGSGFGLYVNGVQVGHDTSTAGTRASFAPIVPIGGTYVLSGSGSIFCWAELY